MISLKGTCIKNEKGEIKDLYLQEAINQGINWVSGASPLDFRPYKRFICIESNGVLTNGCIMPDDCRRLTLADLKPKPKRVNVSYEKCEFKLASKAVEAFENGDKIYIPFSPNGDEICDNPVMSCITIASFFEKDQLFRKIEAEITWQDEAKCFLENTECLSNNHKIGTILSFSEHSVECSEFISMCHLMASITDKPEAEEE